MPIKVILPAAFTKHTGGVKQLDSTANDLEGLVTELGTVFPLLGANIKDEDGKLRRFINVYVNDEDIRFLGAEKYAFKDGDEVTILPAVAGG